MTIDYTKQNSATKAQSTTGVKANVDEGLRAYFLKIYSYMSGALAVTGVVAYFFSQFMQTQAFGNFINSAPWMMYVLAFAPLAYIMLVGSRMYRMSMPGLQLAFWSFAGIMGLSLGYIFLVYTSGSIAKTFFITAAVFGFMSVFGYSTKRDLTKLGSFLIMGVVGIVIASVVNIFMQSDALSFAISVIAVIAFTGLMAYDTQRLKAAYYQLAGNTEMVAKVAICGALSLYLDVINLFIHLLRLIGDRR